MKATSTFFFVVFVMAWSSRSAMAADLVVVNPPTEETDLVGWKKYETYQRLLLQQAAKELSDLRKDPSASEEALAKAFEKRTSTRSYLRSTEYKVNGLLLNQKIAQSKKENASFYSCSATTPTINLEDDFIYAGSSIPGAFKSIPVSNQDGLGTCYANATQNVILGMTGGKINPSFLDLALQHKKNNGDDLSLESGDICSVLDAIEEVGVCDYKYSPLETGERDGLAEILGDPDTKGLEQQANLVKLIQVFLGNKKTLDKSDFFHSERVSEMTYKIKELLRKYPQASYPDLATGNDIFGPYQQKAIVRGASVGTKEAKDKLVLDIRDANYKMSVQYFKMMKQVPTPSVAELKQVWINGLRPLEDKYGSSSYFKENIYQFLDQKIKDHLKNKKQMIAMFDQTQLLAQELKQESVFFSIDDSLNSTCVVPIQNARDYLAGLTDLFSYLWKKNPHEIEAIFRGHALKDPFDILQMSTTPRCAQAENRQKLSFTPKCINIVLTAKAPLEQKLVELRDNVVTKLLQGIPVGNNHVAALGDHVNTIVGYRFNPEKKGCEYLVRESQIGKSLWVSDNEIARVLTDLTIVGNGDSVAD